MSNKGIPDNPKLWNELKAQAGDRWGNKRNQGISPRGEAWLASEYEKAGGGYTNSKRNIKLKNRDLKQEAKDKAKEKEKRRKKKLKAAGFVA